MTNEKDYVLGRDVTTIMSAKERRGTVVLSVRLTLADMARLERLARDERKTLSQIVREALVAYGGSEALQPRITYSVYGGSTLSTGGPAGTAVWGAIPQIA